MNYQVFHPVSCRNSLFSGGPGSQCIEYDLSFYPQILTNQNICTRIAACNWSNSTSSIAMILALPISIRPVLHPRIYITPSSTFSGMLSSLTNPSPLRPAGSQPERYPRIPRPSSQGLAMDPPAGERRLE